MTLEAWVKPAATSAVWRDVVHKGDCNYFLAAASTSAGLPSAGGEFNGGEQAKIFGTATLSAGEWAHLAVTYDGSALRLYVDGNEVSSALETRTLRSSTQPLEIGGDALHGDYFEGLIDEVRVYDVALTGEQVQRDMATPIVAGTPGDRQPPSAPGSLAAEAVGPGEIDLSWQPAGDDVGVAGYELFRCAGEGCTDFAQLAQLDADAASYQDLAVAASSTYRYQLRAVDAAGNTGAFSDAASATTPAPGDSEPPSAPASLSAEAVGPGEIDLSWQPAGDSSGVVLYDLQRCEGAACTDFVPLATTSNTVYSDTTTSAGTTYEYRVRAVDAAGNVGAFSNTASATTPALPPAGPGPIRVGPTGRYLVDESGRPFLMTGDSPQALIGNLSLADADYFLANRKARGFNTVWINLLCTTYTRCNADGSTWDGIAPFTTPGDLSTPNEEYFARADRVIRLAATYGLTVILDPAETGGWLSTLVANGVEGDRAYGRYLGARYKDFPNIIWMSGNDYQAWGPVNDPYVTAVAQGIADVDSRHIQTVELDYWDSGSLEDDAWAPLIDLNASYAYSPTYLQVLADYNRPNFLPTFMVEATYEFEQNASFVPYGDPFALRRQEWWSILSGATGQLYGNGYTWGFSCDQRNAAGDCVEGWKSHLDTPGALQLGHLRTFFEARAWYDLVTDQAHTTVTGGYGTYGDWDYVTAARTPDGRLAIAYVPTARTVTVDLTTLSGPVTARWFDPAAGTYSDISGSPFPNDGSREFTTPGANADGVGNDDWVLVLEVD